MTTTLIKCIDDKAYQAAATAQAAAIVSDATIQALIQGALLLWRRHSEGIISDMREELAARRVAMAEAVLAHAQEGWAQEQALVQETMGIAAPTANYSTMAAADINVERAWGETDAAYDEALRKFGMTVSPCDDIRTAKAMALGKADILAHTMRTAEARKEAQSDVRFSRQNTVLAMGRGVLAEAASMGQLGGYRDNIRKSILGTINSGLSLFSYASTQWRESGGQWGPSKGIPPQLMGAFKSAGYQAAAPDANRQTVALEIANTTSTSSTAYGSQSVATTGAVTGYDSQGN